MDGIIHHNRSFHRKEKSSPMMDALPVTVLTHEAMEVSYTISANIYQRILLDHFPFLYFFLVFLILLLTILFFPGCLLLVVRCLLPLATRW